MSEPSFRDALNQAPPPPTSDVLARAVAGRPPSEEAIIDEALNTVAEIMVAPPALRALDLNVEKKMHALAKRPYPTIGADEWFKTQDYAAQVRRMLEAQSPAAE